MTLKNATDQEGSIFGERLHEEIGQPNTDEDESVFTGRLSFNAEYKTSDHILFFKQVTADDIFPWEYNNMIKTFVMICQVGAIHDKQSSEVQTGVHKITYEQEFEFNVQDADFDKTQFVLAVWQTNNEESREESLIGECTIAMDRAKITSATGQRLEESRKLFKQLVSPNCSKILISDLI